MKKNKSDDINYRKGYYSLLVENSELRKQYEALVDQYLELLKENGELKTIGFEKILEKDHQQADKNFQENTKDLDERLKKLK